MTMVVIVLLGTLARTVRWMLMNVSLSHVSTEEHVR